MFFTCLSFFFRFSFFFLFSCFCSTFFFFCSRFWMLFSVGPFFWSLFMYLFFWKLCLVWTSFFSPLKNFSFYMLSLFFTKKQSFFFFLNGSFCIVLKKNVSCLLVLQRELSSFWASSKNRFVFERNQKFIDSFLNNILFEKPLFFQIFPLYALKPSPMQDLQKTFCHLSVFSNSFWKNIFFIPLFLFTKKNPLKSNWFSLLFLFTSSSCFVRSLCVVSLCLLSSLLLFSMKISRKKSCVLLFSFADFSKKDLFLFLFSILFH